MAICNPTPVGVFDGIPSTAGAGPIPGFMELISSWPTAIPLNNIWSIEFEAPSTSKEINEPKVVGDQWDIAEAAGLVGSSVVNKTFNWYKTNMLANSIKLVGETVKVDRVGASNSEGYLRGIVTKGREDFSTLDVAFIETNYSFADLVIRPWLISIIRDSLISRPNDPKRINISCTMYGLTGPGKSPVARKKFVFFNAFPQAVDGEEYNFTDSEVNLRKVSFAFTHYAMVKVAGAGANLKCNE